MRLVPLGGVAPGALEELAEGLERHLPVRAVPEEGMEALSPLPSAAALEALLPRAPAGAWCLGVTAAPLLGREGEPVFGEAAVGGPVAVVTLHPFERPHGVLASAVHELGHAAGLDHCTVPSCAMYPSRTPSETYAKGPGLCGGCAAILSRAA